MSAITTSKEKHDIFGNLLVLTNGLVELKITTDFGPRIIHCSKPGLENIFYEDTDKLPLGDPQPEYEGEIIKLYGGHRLWISPEFLPSCYYPDNEPVTVKEIKNGVELISPVEKFNNIQKIIRITLDEKLPTVSLTHSIKNCGPFAIEIAPWTITMLSPGGVEIMPQTSTDCGLLPNRNFTLWSYSEMDDPRVTWGKNYLILRQDPKKENPFKFGYNNESGWAAYFNRKQLFVKFFEPELDGVYPDNGCCFETYTNSKIIEMESLGELQIIIPDATISHEETWEIYEADSAPELNDAAIEKALKNVIK